MQCCLWFHSVLRARGPWPKRYGYHLSIFLNYGAKTIKSNLSTLKMIFCVKKES